MISEVKGYFFFICETQVVLNSTKFALAWYNSRTLKYTRTLFFYKVPQRTMI